MSAKLSIVIPMAGYGTRMRPHTWTRPKPLISVAGKPVLGQVLESLKSAPNFENAEITFILGYLGEMVEPYMKAEFPNLKTNYVYQKELLGQSHAIAQAREFINGPTLIVFVDTLIDANYGFLAEDEADAVIWVKEVEDPRRFGVVELGQNQWVSSLIEKPDTKENNLAIVGIYYFKRGEELMQAIDAQIADAVITKNEYFLADAIGLMLEKGLKLQAKPVDIWLDAGIPETVLESNRKLLELNLDNSNPFKPDSGNKIIEPVSIDASAQIKDSVIGPHVSIGANCTILGSQISDSILEQEVEVENSQLSASIIGQRAQISDFQGSLNIGDDSRVSA